MNTYRLALVFSLLIFSSISCKEKKLSFALQEEILEPLALKNTHPSYKRYLPGLASGYARPQFETQFGFPLKVTEAATYCMNPQLEWPGGGINYTAEDLAKWGKLLYSRKVLSRKYTEKATTPTPFETGFKEEAKYGCGTIIWEKDGIKNYGHTGFMFGYVAILEYIPKYDVALSLLLNSDNVPKGHDLHEYLNQLKAILLDNLNKTQ